jgi:hypothetical protein
VITAGKTAAYRDPTSQKTLYASPTFEVKRILKEQERCQVVDSRSTEVLWDRPHLGNETIVAQRNVSVNFSEYQGTYQRNVPRVAVPKVHVAVQ